jgi:hypothetical protein
MRARPRGLPAGGNPDGGLAVLRGLARRVLRGPPMKPHQAIDPKVGSTPIRLPRGVFQKAAHRVGLTREDLLSTARLLIAGLIPDSSRR